MTSGVWRQLSTHFPHYRLPVHHSTSPSGLPPSQSAGVMPLLKVYDSVAQYCSRVSHHRPSTAAAYLPIWHTEVRWLIACRTTRANDKYRFSHIFPALWIPDILCVHFPFSTRILSSVDLLFLAFYLYLSSLHCSMERLEADLDWSLFDPVDVPELSNRTGDAFAQAYATFERERHPVTTFPAKHLWAAICDAQRESGTPFLCYSDNVNRAYCFISMPTVSLSNALPVAPSIYRPTFPFTPQCVATTLTSAPSNLPTYAPKSSRSLPNTAPPLASSRRLLFLNSSFPATRASTILNFMTSSRQSSATWIGYSTCPTTLTRHPRIPRVTLELSVLAYRVSPTYSRFSNCLSVPMTPVASTFGFSRPSTTLLSKAVLNLPASWCHTHLTQVHLPPAVFFRSTCGTLHLLVSTTSAPFVAISPNTVSDTPCSQLRCLHPPVLRSLATPKAWIRTLGDSLSPLPSHSSHQSLPSIATSSNTVCSVERLTSSPGPSSMLSVVVDCGLLKCATTFWQRKVRRLRPPYVGPYP